MSGDALHGALSLLMEQQLRLIPAVKAFIQYEGKILIVREASTYKTGTQIGKYDVPGGQMQPGQTVEENLTREIEEETGLTVQIGQIFHVSENRPVVNGEQRQIVRMYFTCESKSDAITLSQDHDDAQWIDPQDFQKYNLIPNLVPAFEAFLKRTE